MSSTVSYVVVHSMLISPQLGGSYATIPRIAERRSVCNWYQHIYPYPWVGARIVYDVSCIRVSKVIVSPISSIM